MTNNKKSWAVITGANGGLGQALCSTFTENGYSVIAIDFQAQAGASTTCEKYLSADLNQVVEDETYSSALGAQIETLTGTDGLKALINNAAVQNLEAIQQISRASWRETLNVNLSAPLFLSQLLLDQLATAKGSIVNISSIHAHQTKPEFVAYATSKAALSALTRNMALDLKDKVRVNAIEPAAIDTPMLQAGFQNDAEGYARLAYYHPLQRIATPEEISKVALFLCSSAASFLQGSCVNVSGGIQGVLHDPA